MSDAPIRAEGLQATLNGILLPMGLRIDEARLSGGGMTLDPKSARLSLSQPAKAEVRIRAASIASFLELKAPAAIKIQAVRLENGRVEVDAQARVIVSIQAQAVATLRIEAGRRLYLDLVSIEPGPARGLVEGQIAGLNPVLDVADLPIDLVLTSTKIESGWISVFGDLSPKP